MAYFSHYASLERTRNLLIADPSWGNASQNRKESGLKQNTGLGFRKVIFALTFRRHSGLNSDFDSSAMEDCGGSRRAFKIEEFGGDPKNSVCLHTG